jgi:electron transfer flavoprotein alpha subunit
MAKGEDQMKIATVLIDSQHSDPCFANRLARAAFLVDAGCDLALWYLTDKAFLPPAQAYNHVFSVEIANDETYCAESLLPILTSLYARYSPKILLFPADIAGKELGIRLAARLGISFETNISGIRIASGKLTVSKWVYNANLIAQFEISSPAVLIVDPLAFDPASTVRKTLVSHINYTVQNTPAWFSKISVSSHSDKRGIKHAHTVVVCGRGTQNRKNIEKLEYLAHQLGGMIGGTRPAAVAGWVPPSRLIGISGSVIAPDLCFVFGASGARAFAVGIKDSALLIGVNTDPQASIFKICDVGVICDSAEFAEAVSAVIEKEGHFQRGEI